MRRTHADRTVVDFRNPPDLMILQNDAASHDISRVLW
jgi:hypothetical protein